MGYPRSAGTSMDINSGKHQLVPGFFWYSIHRHGVLIREITTEMSGSYGISICISEVPGCDI